MDFGCFSVMFVVLLKIKYLLPSWFRWYNKWLTRMRRREIYYTIVFCVGKSENEQENWMSWVTRKFFISRIEFDYTFCVRYRVGYNFKHWITLYEFISIATIKYNFIHKKCCVREQFTKIITDIYLVILPKGNLKRVKNKIVYQINSCLDFIGEIIKQNKNFNFINAIEKAFVNFMNENVVFVPIV